MTRHDFGPTIILIISLLSKKNIKQGQTISYKELQTLTQNLSHLFTPDQKIIIFVTKVYNSSVIIKIMKIEIRNDIPNSDYTERFLEVAANIPTQLLQLVEDKDIILRLINNVKDISTMAALDYYKVTHTNNTQIKSFTNDRGDFIIICKDFTPINDIERTIYHELGHIIDGYEKFGHIKSQYDLTYSSTSDFINTYREDIANHWNKISRSKNFVLANMIQNSTPERIQQNSATEAFTEIFVHIFNKHPQGKELELYFGNTIKLCREKLSFLGLPV